MCFSIFAMMLSIICYTLGTCYIIEDKVGRGITEYCIGLILFVASFVSVVN